LAPFDVTSAESKPELETGKAAADSEDCVVVTSVRRAAEGVAVRLAEMRGAPSATSLRVPPGIVQVAEADALGRRIGEWQSINSPGQWQGNLSAWQFRTLLFRTG
jgi:hypothetical protein